MLQETTPTISLLSNVEYKENNDVNSFDLWCFKHSSCSLPIYYHKNTYCLCFNCCPECFEYRIKNRLTEPSTPEI